MTYELWHALTSQHHADFDTLDAVRDFMRENYPDSEIEFRDIDGEQRTQRISIDGDEGFEWAVRGPPETESSEENEAVMG